jgi:RNA polymerase sigma-70 factor (ECF subfamily)
LSSRERRAHLARSAADEFRGRPQALQRSGDAVVTSPLGTSGVQGDAPEQAAPVPHAEADLVALLRLGDEAAFTALVTEHHAALCRLAAIYVAQAHVEEVVQDTWMAVMVGVDRFEARSSLRTWLFQILVNQARKRFRLEQRSFPFAALGPFDGAAVVPDDLLRSPELGPGYWTSVPTSWHGDPEGRVLAQEVQHIVAAAVEQLPAAQREVIVLRDVEGWTSDEVCEALGISSVNQRVLLHRARAAVRARIAEYRRD